MTVTILLSQIHHQIYADSDSRLQPITERANQTINHLDSAHHWVLITGKATHFLKAAPEIACRFHRWKECHAEGEADDTGAISMPRTGRPRSFFIDEQPHHCAHQGIQDRRETRCQIPLIDERICCKSCLFATVCWPSSQRPPLPCGKESRASNE